jgi:hypothetical protein
MWRPCQIFLLFVNTLQCCLCRPAGAPSHILPVDFHNPGLRLTLLDCFSFPREYWMIEIWTVFPAVVWFGFYPTPTPLSRQKLSLFFSLPVCRRATAYWRERMRGGGTVGGAKSWRRENWSSINNSYYLVLYFLNVQAPVFNKLILPR